MRWHRNEDHTMRIVIEYPPTIVYGRDTMSKAEILNRLRLYSLGSHGIGGWLTDDTDDRIFDRLDTLNGNPLSKSQLNQLLALGHQAPISDGFFAYYWLQCPTGHPYAVEKLPGFSSQWIRDTPHIISLPHLEWGLYRLFTDGLLYFGNVGTAFTRLRILARQELESFFLTKRFDTTAIRQRGHVLPLRTIPQDDRYLVSEMACKSFGDTPDSEGEMRLALKQAYTQYQHQGGGACDLSPAYKWQSSRSISGSTGRVRTGDRRHPW